MLRDCCLSNDHTGQVLNGKLMVGYSPLVQFWLVYFFRRLIINWLCLHFPTDYQKVLCCVTWSTFQH